MKTFDDLVFYARAYPGGIQAKMFFENGYGVSVVQGSFTYNNDDSEYELAVIRGNIENWELCYDTPVTDDVLGYLSAEAVTKTMQQVQELKETSNGKT